MRPHILLTNDDGISAPGIKHLWNTLQKMADVTVVAPATEQSAVGLSITVRTPLRIEPNRNFEHSPAWSVSGTPADCVKLGIKTVLQQSPSFVISGINRGTNAGRNVFYSGTVAGAIEGTLQAIPSIAFSCHDDDDPNYHIAENYIPLILQHIIEHPLPPGTFLNVNFPAKELKIKGIKVTRQGKGLWIEDPEKRKHPTFQEYYWLGRKLATFDEHEDCDINWLMQGYITAVPVHIGELTDHQQVQKRKNAFDQLFM